MELVSIIYVATGGAVGSVLRYLTMSLIARFSVGDFPYGTLVVNIVGSFLMGVWVATMSKFLPERTFNLHLLFAVGVLGGFTTFSTFSLDVYYLFERGEYMQSVTYILASVFCSLFALLLGMALVR